MTLEELFKPTVIFFGLMNSLVMFQMMMNKILWDLINTGKVASFIDDVIVEMEGEEEYDKVVEEVVKRLCYNRCLLGTMWTWAKSMTIMISCAKVVSVSTSCSRCHNLA